MDQRARAYTAALNFMIRKIRLQGQLLCNALEEAVCCFRVPRKDLLEAYERLEPEDSAQGEEDTKDAMVGCLELPKGAG